MGKRISRRTVLKGFGSSIALPFLESLMLPSFARAASIRTRFCAMAFPNGLYLDPLWAQGGNNWDLNQPAANWTPKEFLANTKQTSFLNGSFTLPEFMLGAIDDVRGDLTIIGGIENSAYIESYTDRWDYGAHPHTAGTWLTNTIINRGSGKLYSISMDQFVANARKDTKSFQVSNEPWEYGENAPSSAYCGNISFTSDTGVKPKMVHPGQLFLHLFGDTAAGTNLGGGSTGGGTSPTPPPIDYTSKQKKSILDYVLEQEADLKRYMSVEDKRIMDQYFTSVREIERRIQSNDADPVPVPQPVSCKVPSRSAYGNSNYPQDYKNNPGVRRPFKYQDNVNLMMDLTVLAFQCDITSVSTYLFGTDASGSSFFRDDGIISGWNGDHHLDYAHKGNRGMMKAANQYYLRQFASFVKKLKAVPEAGGTLLDNTIVHFGSGYADGGKHSYKNIACILAGKGGGTITPNKYIYAGTHNGGNNYALRDVGEVNLTLIRKLGVTTDAWGLKKNGSRYTREIAGL